MRGRIRTIKPEFFFHEELYDLEIRLGMPVRVAFAGLWCYADREGRFKWRPRALRAKILPYDEGADFEAILEGLESIGAVARYTVNGTVYGVVTGFTTHQRPPRDEPASDIPAPDGTVSAYVTPPNGEARQRIYERDGNRCAYCGTDVGGKHSRKRCLDRVLPYSRGGSNAPENLVTSCKKCSATKADKTPDEAGLRWPTIDGRRLGASTVDGTVDGTVNGTVNPQPTPPLTEPSPPVNKGNGKGREGKGTYASRARARVCEELDGVQVHDAYRAGWPLSTEPSVNAWETRWEQVAVWCNRQAERQRCQPAEVLATLLRAFWEDPWCRENGYKVGGLLSEATRLYAAAAGDGGVPAELDQLERLQEKLNAAENRGDIDEVDRLREEIRQLAKAQRGRERRAAS